jgi:dienelactone hydrolase
VAEERESSGHAVSAANFYRRACMIYQMAERFRTPKDAVGLAAFRTSVDCFKRFAKLTPDVRIESVEIPYEGASLPGYFVHAKNSSASRNPCVVFFDGLDVNKELQFSRGVDDLVKRGMSCLVMDGPGTGEAIRFRNYYLRPDYEVAGSACIDFLEKRADVDAKRIAVMAISLGGYYAPRCASMEPRFAACVAWGAIWDYYATWKRRIDAAFNASMSVPGHHIMWILGVDTLDAALAKLEAYRLDGVVQKMRCPFLITHGADDEQVPLADARSLYNASGSADKTLRVFTADEGGAQHCQRDYLSLGASTMFDWLEDKLVRTR